MMGGLRLRAGDGGGGGRVGSRFASWETRTTNCPMVDGGTGGSRPSKLFFFCFVFEEGGERKGREGRRRAGQGVSKKQKARMMKAGSLFVKALVLWCELLSACAARQGPVLGRPAS